MKIVVIGAGVIGITTAYALQRCGYRVTVLDREMGPGLETSFANAGLLTPGMAEPWNAPGSWRVLLASLGRSDAALQLRVRALPRLAGWGLRFLWNSRLTTFTRNALSNVRLALYSLQIMELMVRQTGTEYGRAARGSLRLYRTQATLDQAAREADRLSVEGLSVRRLTKGEIADIEPVLQPIANRFAGALHYETDEIGDAHRFCVALAHHTSDQGTEFRFDTEVSSLEVRGDRVAAVVSRGGHFVADWYIVAAGSYSTQLLWRVGLRLPVRPVKGYSITFDRVLTEPPLRVPVVDNDLHAALVPLDGVLRIAGTAEFAGYDRTLHPARIQNLLRLLEQIGLQEHVDPATARPWCGLRATSADGVPIIGPTPLTNLLVNTGHGHLGWTMAAGSAQLLADLVCEEAPGIDPAPFAWRVSV